jgi:hypothetical protein
MNELNSSDITMSGLDTDGQLYGLFGVCRSGTTAIEKLFALAGVKTFHQPIKSSLVKGIPHIDLECGKPNKSRTTNQDLAIKETLGAYTVATCTFDPLEVMLNSTPDTQEIHTAITVKDPFHNFLSWLSMVEVAPPKTPMSTEHLLDNFILSSQTLFGVYEKSLSLGLRTTIFDYESLKTDQDNMAAQDLLNRLELDPGIYTSEAWSSGGSIDSAESGIIHLVPRADNKLHLQLDNSTKFEYFAPNADLLPADTHQLVQDKLVKAGTYEEYQIMLLHTD